MKKSIVYKVNGFIMVLIFGSAIFIPFSIGIFETDKAISEVEKRALSPLPEIPQTIQDIQTFPQLFENYYSDNFGLRDWFTKYYKLAKYRIGDSPSEDVTIGKNGWFFLGSIKNGYKKYRDPIGDVRNANLYSQHELKKISRYLAGLQAWLNKKDIQYVFVIAPSKHTIYFEQLPDYISKVQEKSATDQLMEYLQEHTDLHVVDLRDQLRKAKETYQLYYKTDSHWNFYGANIAQYEIMTEIEKLFPNQIQPEMYLFRDGMTHSGDLANLLGVPIPKDHDPLPIFGEACRPTRHPLGAKGRVTHTLICKNQKLNAVIFRDSFFNALEPYFARQFNRSTYIWKWDDMNYSSLTKYIKLEQPDIVIEEWVERSLPYVPNGNTEFMNSLHKDMFENSNVLIFQKTEYNLKLNASLNLLDNTNGDLRLRVTGKNPFLAFPLLRLKPSNEYVLHINMASTVQSTMQIFYSDASQTGYPFSGKNSIRFEIKKGDNDLYIALDHPNLGRHLRLDPVAQLGEITIKALEIKKVRSPF